MTTDRDDRIAQLLHDALDAGDEIPLDIAEDIRSLLEVLEQGDGAPPDLKTRIRRRLELLDQAHSVANRAYRF